MTILYRIDAPWRVSSFFPMERFYVLAARGWVSKCLESRFNEINDLSKGLAVMESTIGRLGNPSPTIRF